MSVCTLFGHSQCYGLDANVLMNALEQLIQKGVDTFYVGNQGDFDRMAFDCLRRLRLAYPHISYTVILAYLPTQRKAHDPYDGNTLYPQGLEEVPQRFAITRRNRWMVERSDICLCYIAHTWGGAYQAVRIAKRRGLEIINLSDMPI
jgi:uncharacterized phage-like protein YoqJ